MKKGKVYLIGAGPADPELLTRKGAKILSVADCVIYDRLVDPQLLKLAKPAAKKIYVGKSTDSQGRGQRKINGLLVLHALKGQTVARLKGGDPALFGRLSEEIETLERFHIRYEVIPGVSSVWAAATALGIPLTDRRFSSSVALVTGHRAAGRYPAVRWKELSRGADTLVILMGRAGLSDIVRRLLSAGRAPQTPIALVRWASAPKQQIFISTLGQIRRELKNHPEFKPPVVAIVGQVVRLARAGQENSLQGTKILLTRPKGENERLQKILSDLGAECRVLPTIEIRPKTLTQSQALILGKKLPEFDWIIFNSHHAVEAVTSFLQSRKVRIAALRAKISVVGPRTETAAKEAGFKPALIGSEFSKEGVVKAFSKISLRGKKIFIPRSNLGAGDRLAQSLRRQGAYVEEAVMYKTVAAKIPTAQLKRALLGLDAATFTSASTANSFLSALAKAKLTIQQAFNGAAVVAIGPSTARALRQGGVKQVYQPSKEWTLEGLAGAVNQAVHPEQAVRPSTRLRTNGAPKGSP